MMLKISTRFIFFLITYLSLPFLALSQTINPSNGILFQNSLSNSPGSDFAYSGFNQSSPGTELRLTATQLNWKSQLLVNQTFHRQEGLTFEGKVFIPYNSYKAVMIGFHDGDTNSEKGIQHGLYFFDNGGGEVTVQARNGNDAQSMPVNAYANNDGIWLDYKIALHNTGATYYVKESSETDYTNVMTYDGGTNLPELKVGIQANKTSSGTTTYTAHKDWKIYQPLTLYVNKNASGDGSGNSWDNAVTQLADALKWAKENENDWNEDNPLRIYMAGGTYTPMYSPADNNFGNADDKYNAFLLVKNVQLYGGFAGTETSLADRDLSLTANATVLSSDVNGDDAISGSGSSLAINNTSDNNLHVMIAVGDMENALLDGFTVTGGNAGSSGNITVNGKSVYKNRGGGIYCRDASLTFNHIIITGNTADAFGGGLYNDDNSSPVLLNTLINRNISAKGAGVCNDTSNPIFTNVTIAGNQSTGEGGGMYNSNASPIINNSILYSNSAVTGTEIYNDSANPTFSYSLVGNSGGSASWDGTFGTDGVGNLDDDPLFTDAGAGNYIPADGSPVINTGSNTLYTNAGGNLSADNDLAGTLRVFHQAVIDIGAYEGVYPIAPVYSNNGTISKKYGNADFTLSVQSTSTGAISYTSGNTDVATISGNTVTITGAGETEITVNQLATEDYLAGSTSFTLTVNKASLTITADDKTIQEGETLPAFTATYTGFVNGEDESVLTALPIFNTEATLASAPGNYDIEVSGAEAGNYSISYSNGILTIEEGTLPVDLLMFSVSTEGNYAKLLWQTASESNNKEYIISRSTDGVQFVELGRIVGENNRNAVTDYSYIDLKPLNGINYYKLSQADNNGKVNELDIRTVTFNLQPLTFNLYPNPTNSIVSVVLETGQYDMLTITDVNGKVLQHIQINPDDSHLMVLEGYPTGTYLLCLSGNGGTEIRKIVKR